jgi:hypothetical protein
MPRRIEVFAVYLGRESRGRQGRERRRTAQKPLRVIVVQQLAEPADAPGTSPLPAWVAIRLAATES